MKIIHHVGPRKARFLASEIEVKYFRGMSFRDVVAHVLLREMGKDPYQHEKNP